MDKRKYGNSIFYKTNLEEDVLKQRAYLLENIVNICKETAQG
jgi:hypothetical protein